MIQQKLKDRFSHREVQIISNPKKGSFENEGFGCIYKQGHLSFRIFFIPWHLEVRRLRRDFCTRGFIIGVALTCLDSEHDLLSVKNFFWQPTAVTNDHLFIASTNFTIMIQPDLNPLDSKPLRFVDFGPPVSTAVSSIKMAWLSGTKDFKCGNCQFLDYHVKGWGRNLLTRETPTPFLHPRDGPWYGEGIWDPW